MLVLDFANCFFMASGIGGFAPSDIRNNLIWNRVINVTGKPGGNIGMDLGTEHINMDYEGMSVAMFDAFCVVRR